MLPVTSCSYTTSPSGFSVHVRSTYLKHCHEIYRFNKHLYLASTGHDSILAFDLEKQAFFWAIHLANTENGPVGTAYDPQGIKGPGGANGPPAENRLHLNNVHANRHGLFASGLRTGGLFSHRQTATRCAIRWRCPREFTTRNPFREGVLFNDTSANALRHVEKTGRQIHFPVPMYPEDEIEHGELADEHPGSPGLRTGPVRDQ